MLIYEHIFEPYGDLRVYYSSNCFGTDRENWIPLTTDVDISERLK